MASFRFPARLPQENSRQYAYRVLYDAIMCFEIEPGQALSENELSEAMELSRTPIREAVLALQNSRLVEVLPQRSSCVTRIKMSYVEEGVFLRHAIETAILREAIAEADENDLSMLHENLSLQRLRLSEQRWSDYVTADDEFHKLLYFAAKKPWTYSSVSSITTHLTRLRHLLNRADINTLSQGCDEHFAFYGAIAEKKDVDVNKAVYEHLTAGYRRVLPMLKKDYPHYFSD